MVHPPNIQNKKEILMLKSQIYSLTSEINILTNVVDKLIEHVCDDMTDSEKNRFLNNLLPDFDQD